MANVKQQLQSRQELVNENADLKRQLQESQEKLNAVTKELQFAKDKMSSWKQDVKEKEQIEIQNETLMQRLQDMSEEVAETEGLKEKLEANETIVINNDEMLRNVELELEETRAELEKRPPLVADGQADLLKQLQEKDKAFESLQKEMDQLRKDVSKKRKLLLENDEELADTRYQLLAKGNSYQKEARESDFDASRSKEEVIHKLQTELKQLEAEKSLLKVNLKNAKMASEKHLVELATVREKVREMERDLATGTLQAELKQNQEQKALLKETLESARMTNEKHLVELATNREKVREMQGDLEEAHVRIAELESLLHANEKESSSHGYDHMKPSPKRQKTGREEEEQSDESSDNAVML
mmetsp:Transcript_20135/g.35467  ORF Transcript_20135/g.35467 Transcript_20135/m.35467 type:complete len:358 (-) Transcript_20135:282-1355(-)